MNRETSDDSGRMSSFPSSNWARAFQTAINENAGYARAAAAWEGDILFEVLENAETAHGAGIYLDLFHGQCREARYVPDATAVSAEFNFRATAENWRRLMRRELDPIKAFLNGTIKMSGNPSKIMRYVNAAKELLETAASLPADL